MSLVAGGLDLIAGQDIAGRAAYASGVVVEVQGLEHIIHMVLILSSFAVHNANEALCQSRANAVTTMMVTEEIFSFTISIDTLRMFFSVIFTKHISQ